MPEQTTFDLVGIGGHDAIREIQKMVFERRQT